MWTLHDCWAYTGHCAYYTSKDCYKWMTGCDHCSQKQCYPLSILLDNSRYNFEKKKFIFGNCPDLTIVTPSQWLAGEVGKSFLSVYPRKVIYNGIDLDVFKPAQSDFRKMYHLEDKKIILGVANVWTERKGLYVFDDLAQRLDDTYKVVLVGITKKQRSQMNSRILCINRTSSKEELAEIYTAADLFLNPSVEETMGLTTVEALACGTNVLVSNCTALPEIVDYKRELIVSDNEWNEGVHKVASFKQQRQKNVSLAAKYDSLKQYQKYIDLYEEKSRG